MRARVVLLLAALLLAPAYLLSPPQAPPLYDGVDFPDEPYRTLGATPPPTSGSVRAAVRPDGSNPVLTALTREVGPQAAVQVPPGAVTVPAGGREVRLRVEPVPVPAPSPSTGRTLSNAYRVELTDERGTALPALARPATVQLRLSTPVHEQVVVQVFTDGWTDAPTRVLREDLYSADLSAPAVVVAVQREARVVLPPEEPSGGPGGQLVGLLLGGGLLTLVATVLILRSRPDAGGPR